jgi:hypothetical protein
VTGGELDRVKLMAILLAGLVGALTLAGLVAFLSWRRRVLALVRNGSEIVQTAQGAIEFAPPGTGPIIVQLHG